MLRSVGMVLEIPLWMQVLAVPLVWAVFAAVVIITALVVDMVRVYLDGGIGYDVPVTDIGTGLREAERFESAA